MRDRPNPVKDQGRLPAYGHHRVVVPVHIPNLEGYFAQSRSILRRCLDSLRLSAAGRVAVTLISDGSCPEALADLRARLDEGWVDQLIVNHTNRGKVDAVVGVARGSHEELITVSDADVLFRPGWVDAVEQLFVTFPECGFASLFPSSTGTFALTSSTLLGGLCRRELRLAPVSDPGDLARFAASIGNPDLYPPAYRKLQWTLEREGLTACVGAPHWVFTMRRSVIRAIPAEPARRAVGISESRWLDEPADRLGYWRLATHQAYAHHMGNVPEPWMDEELAAAEAADAVAPAPRPHPGVGRRPILGRLPARLRLALVGRVLRPRLERRIHRSAGAT